MQRFNDGLIQILKECVIYAVTHKSSLLKNLTQEEA